MVLATAQPAFIGGSGGGALVIHRHGSYGIHYHLVGTGIGPAVELSPAYGHMVRPPRLDWLGQVVRGVTVVIHDFDTDQDRGVTQFRNESLSIVCHLDGAAPETGKPDGANHFGTWDAAFGHERGRPKYYSDCELPLLI